MVYGDRIGDRIGLSLYVYEVLFFKLFWFGIVSCEYRCSLLNLRTTVPFDRVNFSVENLFYGILLIFVRVSVDNA